MRAYPMRLLAVAAAFLLATYLWNEFGNTLLEWQNGLPDVYRYAFSFFVGTCLWHITGFDDAILFAGNYSSCRNPRERLLSHLGLYVAVALMLALVYVSGSLIADFIRNLRWFVVAALSYVAWDTFPDNHWLKGWILSIFGKTPEEGDDEDDESSLIARVKAKFRYAAAYPFVVQFMTFTVNSSDDYVANTAAVMVLKDQATKFALLSGVMFGAVTMALLVSKFHEKIIPRDVPAIRAWIFLGIAAVIAVF